MAGVVTWWALRDAAPGALPAVPRPWFVCAPGKWVVERSRSVSCQAGLGAKSLTRAALLLGS